MKHAGRQIKHRSDEDWLAAENATERARLMQATGEFLRLLRAELIQQHNRRRDQFSDDHD